MQKPSERILELYSEHRKQEDVGHATLFAIINFLDEQATKQDLSSEHIETKI